MKVTHRVYNQSAYMCAKIEGSVLGGSSLSVGAPAFQESSSQGLVCFWTSVFEVLGRGFRLPWALQSSPRLLHTCSVLEEWSPRCSAVLVKSGLHGMLSGHIRKRKIP